MGRSSQKLATLVSVVLFPAALLLFSSGFFPYKPFLPGLATFEDEINSIRPPAVFDKVIFMVVDALRSDFVYSNHSAFEFTQDLIRKGSALPFTARANSPTITMPRVKAITTGSVPSFLDVILNFAESDTSSTLAHQDTWLAQIKARPGGRLVMYGDDTWLKLFPGMFERHDGTTSFFVSDFYEVDNNVTRHIPEELLMDDWSGMIMHYLGLDHIGHKAGPYSPHMIPKHEEMDAVVKQIFTAMEEQAHLNSTLLVLCGDHGMNDAGNHGGASPGETSPALTFISPTFQRIQDGQACPQTASTDFEYYKVVEQSDIAPSLAGLLGFPIPLNNLGVFIPDLLSMWPPGLPRLQLLLENAKQILNVVKATYPRFDDNPTQDICASPQRTDLSKLECQWQQASQLAGAAQTRLEALSDAEASLLEFCRTAQTIMSNASSNYNLMRLYQGTVVAAVAVLLSFMSVIRRSVTLSGATTFLSLITSSYAILMFASSYVEEEQQFWYWIFTGWASYLYMKNYSRADGGVDFKSALLLAGLSRVTRRWNQTGQKFAGEPDIATTFFFKYPESMWVMALLTFADIYSRLRRPNSENNRFNATLFYLPLISFTFIYKVAFTNADAPELLRLNPIFSALVGSVGGIPLLHQARMVFIGLGVATLYTLYLKFKSDRDPRRREKEDFSSTFHAILTLFLITQSRVTNIPLFAIFQLQLQVLSSMNLHETEIAVTSLLLQYTAFFAFGGSNAISSIDISNAYNGIGSYNVLLVGILTFISNWAGPIWWVSATHCMLRDHRYRNPQADRASAHIELWTLFVACSLLAVMLACTILRAHLFIWTVFSPKFLYSAAWSLGQHVIINIFFGEFILRRLYT